METLSRCVFTGMEHPIFVKIQEAAEVVELSKKLEHKAISSNSVLLSGSHQGHVHVSYQQATGGIILAFVGVLPGRVRHVFLMVWPAFTLSIFCVSTLYKCSGCIFYDCTLPHVLCHGLALVQRTPVGHAVKHPEYHDQSLPVPVSACHIRSQPAVVN